MHHNNFGNFYTRGIYAIPIPIAFIPIPIMSRMAIPIPMGFPWGLPLPCTPLICSNGPPYSSICSRESQQWTIVFVTEKLDECEQHSLQARYGNGNTNSAF